MKENLLEKFYKIKTATMTLSYSLVKQWSITFVLVDDLIWDKCYKIERPALLLIMHPAV